MSLLLCCFRSNLQEKEKSADLPKIVVTCHEEENSGRPLLERQLSGDDSTASESPEPKPAAAGPVKTELADKNDLSHAHEEVIQQMRNAIKEARGGNTAKTSEEKSTPAISLAASVAPDEVPDKPPVPPTKAIAVAKIKAAIAQSKEPRREKSPSQPKAQPQPQQSNNNDKMLNKSQIVKQINTQNNVQTAAIETTKAKVRAALLMAALETVQQEKAAAARAVPTNHGKSNGKPPCNNDTVNNAKQSIIVKNGDENSDPQLQRSQSAKGSSNINGDYADPQLHRSQSARGRRKISGEQTIRSPDKPKAVIWDFFEQGKSKHTCRTCGYTMSAKTKPGGLVRHLSLVHQAEYRRYNMRMESNWTHGMMEKNLNMKLPKNF